jgi:hypothetical protein
MLTSIGQRIIKLDIHHSMTHSVLRDANNDSASFIHREPHILPGAGSSSLAIELPFQEPWVQILDPLDNNSAGLAW